VLGMQAQKISNLQPHITVKTRPFPYYYCSNCFIVVLPQYFVPLLCENSITVIPVNYLLKCSDTVGWLPRRRMYHSNSAQWFS